MFASTPSAPNEESYLTLSHLSQILSHNALFWPLSPELFDPVDEFDGDPSRLIVPPPSLTYDSSDDDDEYDCAKTPSPVMLTEEDMVLCEEQGAGPNNPCPQPYYMDVSVGKSKTIFRRSSTEEDENENNDMGCIEWHTKEEEDPDRLGQTPRRRKRRRVKEPRQYECRICHATFNRSYNLKTHQLTHNKKRIKRFECPLCHKGFDRKHDQQRHIAAMHSGKTNKLVCYACNAQFRRRDAMVKHLATDHS